MEPQDKKSTGLVIVDHGSRKSESNQKLIEFVDLYRQATDYRVVEPAHMELASPSIEDAFQACVQQGAKRIIVCPFFLLPGRHWQQDIPNLSRQASQKVGGIPYLVTSPIGVHAKLIEILESRIDNCLNASESGSCNSCSAESNCQTHSQWVIE